MEMLTCTKCKVQKPGDTVYFPPHHGKRNGLDSWCRVCRSGYRNEICRGRYRNAIDDESLVAIKGATTECVICGSGDDLVVDHDHKTTKIRGILCGKCNRGLGNFRDDPDLLEFARMYLLASLDSQEWDEYFQVNAEHEA